MVAVASSCFSQEPTYMDAATHPGAGQLYWRLLASRSEYEEAAGENADLSIATLKLSYGIRPTIALVLAGELAHLSSDGHDESGLRQATLQLKYRVFKRDLGPLNTWRTSLLGGITIPGDLERSSPEESYPRVSIVTTAILGRHGLNAEAGWEEHGGEADRIAINASHLFRLSPAEYRIDTRGAWYTMLESLNQFDDHGDSRSDLAAGILYEARNWALEASLRLPVAQNSQRDDAYTITVGVRLLP
jgi:hypothetical protein